MKLKLPEQEMQKFLFDIERFLIPLGILYLTTVSSRIGLQDHVITTNDFIPNQIMIGGIITYLLSSAQNYLTKLKNS